MRKTGSRSAIIAVILLGLILFGIGSYAWTTASDIFQPVSPPGKGRTIPLEIVKGESTAQIADVLQAKGLIKNALAFRIWARIKGLDTHLQAGIYQKLNTSMTISDITDQLLNALPDAVRVVIPEGWRLEQIGLRFANSGLVRFNMQDFLTYAKNINKYPDAGKYPILKIVPQDRPTMEGLLFPASYEVAVDSTARDVVGMMLKTTTDVIAQNHLDKLAQQHQMNLYQMLTLASIVERETLFDEDRAKIASVYWNRLYRPNAETVGLLQADPTVQYARDTLNAPQTYWLPLNDVGGNIAAGSPWNTYVYKGLPPTPICSPGLASMMVAAAPPQTNLYFFLAKKDGHSVFESTLAQFLQDRQKYLP